MWVDDTVYDSEINRCQTHKTHLVGEMSNDVVAASVVVVYRQTHVAFVIQHQVGSHRRYQHVGSDVELLPVQQQRVRDVPENRMKLKQRSSLVRSVRSYRMIDLYIDGMTMCVKRREDLVGENCEYVIPYTAVLIFDSSVACLDI